MNRLKKLFTNSFFKTSKFRFIFLSILSIVLVSMLLIGNTYSIFTNTNIDETLNVYKTGTLNVTYTTSGSVSLSDNKPTSTEDSIYIVPYRLTVTNNGDVPYMFNLNLVDTTATNAIDYQYVMVQVGKLEAKTLKSCTDAEEENTKIIKEDIVVAAGESVDVDIRVWVSDTVQNTEIEKSFNASLIADGRAIYYDTKDIDNSILINPSNEFVTEIMEPNAVSDENIDFSVISSTSGTNGIYTRTDTENNTTKIYYYRGNVDNNLIFADICWKIVRTTETGGLKLVYNGLPTNGQCNNTGTSSQISTRSFNENSTSTYESLAYVGYMYSNPYFSIDKEMSSITDAYVYGNDVTYSNGTYTLTDTITSSSWSTLHDGGLKDNHYTCFSTETTCDSVYYIHNTSSSHAYYITLTDGKNVEQAITEMLGADDENTVNYNTNSSGIKGNNTTSGTLDYWYYTNIEQKGYSDYIEDTIWCNDRSIYSLGGFNPDGGLTNYSDVVNSGFIFSVYARYISYSPSLNCSRNIDKFTVNRTNGNGDLDYPVGLLTLDEGMLAGGGPKTENTSYYLYTGQNYWTGSAAAFYKYNAYVTFENTVGGLDFNYTAYNMGVRPAISLKPGFSLDGGSGTTSNPYIVS